MELRTVQPQGRAQPTKQKKVVQVEQAVQDLEHVFGMPPHVEIKNVQRQIRHLLQMPNATISLRTV